MRTLTRIAAPILALAALQPGGIGQQDLEAHTLAPDSLDRWLTYLLPGEDEVAWLEIPWRATLWEAVRVAHEQQRPVLLWAMNGHPLGCT